MNNNTTILIVEDSLTQAKRLEYLLSKTGYAVLIARNGVEGLEMAREKKPTVIITDVMMPEMDGYDMCRHIKDEPELAAIPIIILTALSDPEDVIKGLKSGADNFHPKPYDPEHLLQRIKLILTNLDLRKAGQAQMTVEVFFSGQYHRLTADRIQIIDLLLSTFETAVAQNSQLKQLGGEYRNALEGAKQAHANFQALMETMEDAVVVINQENRIYYANPAAELLFGASIKELQENPSPLPEKIEEHSEIRIPSPEGGPVIGDLRVGTCNWNGELVRLVTIRDITETVRLRELLQREACTDSLTGLYNRRGFFAKGAAFLEEAQKKNLHVTCLFADLDGMKNINDTLGHEEGDKALQETAAMMQQILGSWNILARVGGDEFAALVEHEEDQPPRETCQKIQKAMEKSNQEGKHSYCLAISVGVASWNPCSPISLGELLSRGDKKMYEHKDSKKASC